MDQLLDPCPCLRHGQIFQKRSELHDKCNLSGSKDLSDDNGGDQRKGNKDVRLNIKSRNKSDDRFQNDRDPAQDDCDPRRVYMK